MCKAFLSKEHTNPQPALRPGANVIPYESFERIALRRDNIYEVFGVIDEIIFPLVNWLVLEYPSKNTLVISFRCLI